MKAIEKPLTRDELRQQQAEEAAVKAVVSVPWDKTGDIEALNDLASEKITGSEVGLEDIGYRLVGADLENQEVLLEVVAQLAEDEDEDDVVEMLDGTKWLLMAGIDNDAEGAAVEDVTLGRALASVQGGYNPDMDDYLDMEPVERDLKRLIGLYGEDKMADELLTDEDWQERANGDLQARARKGH